MTDDRGSNILEEETNKNYVEDEIFRRRPIQLISDYQLEIRNIKTYNGDKETRYFERGQEVTVSFDSNNTTELLLKTWLQRELTQSKNCNQNGYICWLVFLENKLQHNKRLL